MKKLTFSLFAVALASSAMAQAANTTETIGTPSKTDSSKAKIKFEDIAHNFGSVIEGQVARFDFKFTNTGTDPLVLTNVQASCGCTTPKWPREAIAPGASAVVTAEYNSAGREGNFTKNIFVYSNGGDATLTITGIVVKEAEKPKSVIIGN
jgi:Protein of unknown function (DUF1573)